MNRRCVLACAIIISFVTTTYAHANWQDTQWGQSPEDLSSGGRPVEAVVGAEMEDRSFPTYGKPLLSGRYEAGSEAFSVDYLFNDGRLSGVVLYMADRNQAMRVGDKLSAQYGAPERDQSNFDGLTNCTTENRTWRDGQRGNLVTFWSRYCVEPSFKTSQYLIYRPIVSSSASGL